MLVRRLALGSSIQYLRPQPAVASFSFHALSRRLLTTTSKMSTDDDYAAFLDKANQDTGSSKPPQKDSKFASTKAVDTDIPAPLKKLGDSYYTSDTDEPFEAVALGHNGKELDKRKTWISHRCSGARC